MSEEAKKKPGRPKVYKAKVSGKIANFDGGYYEAGDELPKGCDIESLKAKGLAE